jgi:hypothetical protein
MLINVNGVKTTVRIMIKQIVIVAAIATVLIGITLITNSVYKILKYDDETDALNEKCFNNSTCDLSKLEYIRKMDRQPGSVLGCFMLACGITMVMLTNFKPKV